MENYWDNFEQSGKIEDYLRYKGIENIDGKISGGLDETCESKRDSNKGITIQGE